MAKKPNAPTVGSVRVYIPGLMDRMDHPELTAGTKVKVVQPPGTPVNGTGNCVYIQVAESERFVGLVNISSLSTA